MRGRKPKPSYLRVLDGNAGRRPENPDEPKPVGDLEEQAPPEWMTEDQKAGWRYAMQHSPPGLLKKLDRSIMTGWVVAESLHAKAAQEVARLGILLKAKSGIPYQNPYLAVLNKQAALMFKAAAEMGFTPSSRSRVKVEPPAPGAGDTFGDLKQITDE